MKIKNNKNTMYNSLIHTYCEVKNLDFFEERSNILNTIIAKSTNLQTDIFIKYPIASYYWGHHTVALFALLKTSQ